LSPLGLSLQATPTSPACSPCPPWSGQEQPPCLATLLLPPRPSSAMPSLACAAWREASQLGLWLRPAQLDLWLRLALRAAAAGLCSQEGVFAAEPVAAAAAVSAPVLGNAFAVCSQEGVLTAALVTASSAAAASAPVLGDAVAVCSQEGVVAAGPVAASRAGFAAAGHVAASTVGAVQTTAPSDVWTAAAELDASPAAVCSQEGVVAAGPVAVADSASTG